MTAFSDCPANQTTGFLVAIIVGSSLMGGGLLMGLIVFIRVIGKGPEEQQTAAALLFYMSFVLWGASFFSAILSMRIARKRPTRSCCSCGCSWVFICGVFEMMGVLMGFLAGLIIDASQLSWDPTNYNTYFYYNFFNATLMIGMPTVLGTLLTFGIPRICISNSLSKASKHKRFEDDEESRPMARDTTPINYQSSAVAASYQGAAYPRVPQPQQPQPPMNAYPPQQNAYPPQPHGSNGPPPGYGRVVVDGDKVAM